jgi:hypothetical protein
MIKPSSDIILDPFTVLYVGFGKVIINKGFVIDASNGKMTTIEGLTDAWRGSPEPMDVASGDTISLKISHDSRDDYKKYDVIGISGAEIVIGEESSETSTVVKIATVEYDEDGYRIEQFLNSDVFIAIRGTINPTCN